MSENTQPKYHVIFSHGKESGPLGHKIQCLMAVAEELEMNAIR